MAYIVMAYIVMASRKKAAKRCRAAYSKAYSTHAVHAPHYTIEYSHGWLYRWGRVSDGGSEPRKEPPSESARPTVEGHNYIGL